MTSRDAAYDLPAEAVLDLVTAIRRAAVRWPDRTALVFDETGESPTFAELATRVDRVATALAGLGIDHGDRVGIMLPNRIDWPLAWLGLARIGAVMVPVNTGYRTADTGFVLRHAGVRAVVTTREFVPLLHDVRADIAASFPARPRAFGEARDLLGHPPGRPCGHRGALGRALVRSLRHDRVRARHRKRT